MTYEEMEEVLKTINTEIISPYYAEIKNTKKILLEVLEKFGAYMSEDAIFKKLFQGFDHCHNDNLKVKRPYEFDMFFLLALPKCESCRVKNCSCISIRESTCHPGYLIFELDDDCCSDVYQKFCWGGKMQTNLVFNWMKSLIYKALNRLKDKKEITNFSQIIYYTEKSPSFKICVTGEFGEVFIDFTAAFKFDEKYWPEGGFKQNTSNKIDYFTILPKSPKNKTSYWMPSFRVQEKELIKKKERLKPAFRLLKQMKINRTHTFISNYMLKTLILEESDKFEWMEISLSETFMILLEKYITYLREECIPYYWNNSVNLLEDIPSNTLENHYNEISKLYRKIKREYSTDPTVIAEVILRKNSADYNKFMDAWNAQNRALCLPSYGTDDRDDEDSDSNMAAAVGLGAVGVVAAVGIGALIWEAFSSSKRNQRPRE